MEHATLIVLLALLQYMWFTIRTGATRGKYNIDAPSCEGNETWERFFRVQQNTLEQLIILVPASYAFAHFVSDRWVMLPGLAFIIGRFLYSATYIKDPKKRAPGMALTLAANASILVGALIGLLMHMF
jgi:glutathione S-transferase